MSTLTKWLILLVAWLVFSFVTLRTCIQPQCCPGGEDGSSTEAAAAGAAAAAASAETAEADNNYALATRFKSSELLEGGEWPSLRASLLEQYQANPNQELEIYGHYYEGEAAPEGFETMGFYRAALIRDLLMPDIPEDKIRLLSRRLNPPNPAADATWNAATFNWSAIQEEGEAETTEIIQLDADEIIIRFPFNSAQKDADPAVDEYLQKLAQRLQQTEETVVITGHTDNVGSDDSNMKLGQRRADFIKSILTRHGAPAARISTRSEGESNPVDSNSTPTGQHNNRRAVVKLMSN
ncbi:MAG: OmpA family protein [Bacteroidota bacterium]